MTGERLLEGRVALITGASRGIGAATARLLARHGAAVGINYYKSGAEAKQLADEIAADGGRAVTVRANVRSSDEVAAMVRLVEADLGPIDLLVLNAGKVIRFAPALEFKFEDLQNTIADELKGAHYAVQAVVPGMVARRKGSIVAVTSTASRHQWEGSMAHSMAKAALDSYIRSLALELGQFNVRANLIAPGLTITEAISPASKARTDEVARATPLRRNAHPEDVAGAILMVASDNAAFVSGAYIPVSGGLNMG
ncbi:MAG: SDR family oxidoreductase [Cyanobacteria bacterium SZAS LIN-3]|nr:SDR family oxidoreductase [Cyanobacteria bacterium SZAS LIN-3]